ncbi:MAG: class II aldolase/adducin family protein, partial [Thermodesulfobacteriota bacterium]
MPGELKIIARAGPKARDQEAAEVIFAPGFECALQGLQVGREYLLLTWQEQEYCQQELAAVNPIGLHRAYLSQVNGRMAVFAQLQLPEQTPILEVRPLPAGAEAWGQHVPKEEALKLKQAARQAWEKGLISGFNSNLSLRQQQRVIITCSGAAKAFIQPGDLVCLDLCTGQALGEPRASSEAGLHLRLYQEQPMAEAVVHTHPPGLLSL